MILGVERQCWVLIEEEASCWGRTAPCFEVADGGGFGLRWGVCGRGGHCGSGRVDQDGFRELGIE